MKRGRPPKHAVHQFDEAKQLLIEAYNLKRDGAKRINETLAGPNRQADAFEKRRYRAKKFVVHEAAAAIKAEIEKLRSGMARRVYRDGRLYRIGTRKQLAEIVIAEAEKAFQKPDKK